MHEGRWAEAGTHWEILLLLRPDQQDYVKELAEARSHSNHAAAEYLQEAEQARGQGQPNRAATLYLKALSADPGNDKAAQALRDTERERARRANFGPSVRGGTGEIPLNLRRSSKPAATPSTVEGRELDAAILLLHQGDDSAAAFQTLETYARKNPHDDLGRRALQDAYVDLARQRSKQGKKEEALAYLEKAQGMRDNKSGTELTRAIKSLRKDIAEDYYQQGLRAQSTNLSEAIRLWEKVLKSDPEHAQAARQLERARKMERDLRSMQDANTKP
jgi:tetratricopeptide (TPR) repeat protein